MQNPTQVLNYFQMATLVSEPITATWESSGAGVTGLTPSIRIIDLSDNSTVLTDTMTAVDAVNSPGTYVYTFDTFDVSKKYIARLDGGAGQEDRYRTLALRADTLELAQYLQDNSLIGGGGGRYSSDAIVEKLLNTKIKGRTIREILGAEKEDLTPWFTTLEQFITSEHKKTRQDSLQATKGLKTEIRAVGEKIVEPESNAPMMACQMEMMEHQKELETAFVQSQNTFQEILGQMYAQIQQTQVKIETDVPAIVETKIEEKSTRMRVKGKKLQVLDKYYGQK